ncbi:hypothetical protein FDZ73_01025 [bacterium]|nr:MAG: hypothetical protein FDZ73_01025 [bacterium]
MIALSLKIVLRISLIQPELFQDAFHAILEVIDATIPANGEKGERDFFRTYHLFIFNSTRLTLPAKHDSNLQNPTASQTRSLNILMNISGKPDQVA